MTTRIYLDHAATTPVRPEAVAAMREGLEHWANPSSPHADGRAARAMLEDARARIKATLGWTGELIFTSGASEALQLALRRTRRPVIASAVEHDAVYRAAPDARIVPIGANAEVDRDALRQSLSSAPSAIVVVQQANSETGTIQPVEELAADVRAHGGLLLSDCSQSAGKIALPDADLIVVSAHKLGGPPGIGALLVRDLGMLEATGGQEFGYRAGTQNLPGALGFAAALEQGSSWLSELEAPLERLRSRLIEAGASLQPSAGGAALPNVLAVTTPAISAPAQLVRLDLAGFSLSAGSACSSGSMKPSRALAAFGIAADDASCTIRLSAGWTTTAQDLECFFDAWLALAPARRGHAA